MGLFSKFKSKASGGVVVKVQAPSSVPSNQVIPVKITITSDTSQTIKSIKAEVKARAKEQGFSVGSQGAGMQTGTTTEMVVAKAENRDAFTVNPGETKTIDMQLFVDSNQNLAMSGNISGPAAGVMKAVTALAQGMNHISYLYTVHAYADVDGHAFNPSDKQDIQLLPPSTAQQTATTVSN